jgi:hypothetical protein
MFETWMDEHRRQIKRELFYLVSVVILFSLIMDIQILYHRKLNAFITREVTTIGDRTTRIKATKY